jgi:hypothetical protein
MRRHARTLLFLVTVFLPLESCKSREPSATEHQQADEPNGDPRYVLPLGLCKDNDADCPSEQRCNRTRCSEVPSQSPTGLMRTCSTDEDCVLKNKDRYLCREGYCKWCLTTEECTEGGKRAGWYCVDNYCSTNPEPPHSLGGD